MKLPLLSALIICIALVSCNNDNTGDGVYYNDFETMGYWTTAPHLKKGVGHSGLFCTYTDSSAEYSEGMSIPLGDIKVAGPKTVTATAWIMTNDLNAQSQLVLNLDSAGKSVAWNGTQIKTVLQAPGKWFEITCTIALPAKTSPDEKIYLFGWNGGKGTVYYDDVQLKVE